MSLVTAWLKAVGLQLLADGFWTVGLRHIFRDEYINGMTLARFMLASTGIGWILRRFIMDHIQDDITQANKLHPVSQSAVASESPAMQDLLNNLGVGVMVVDASQTIHLMNAVVPNLLGLSDAQMRGDDAFPQQWSAYLEHRQDQIAYSITELLQLLATCAAQRHHVLVIHRGELAHSYLSISVGQQTGHDASGYLQGSVGHDSAQTVYTLSNITQQKRTERSLLQQAERERSVSAISQRIRQSLDLDQILRTTVGEVRQFLAADRVVLGCLQPPAHIQIVSESAQPSLSPVLGLILTDVVSSERHEFYRQGQIFVVNDTQQEVLSDPVQKAACQHQVGAFICAPIIQGNQLWGFMIAQQRHPRVWDIADVEMIRPFSTQVAIATQQSRLYEQVQAFNARLESQVAERTHQLEQALEFEATLKLITDKVRDSLEEDQILQTAVRELGSVLGASSCNAAMYDLNREISAVCYEYTTSSITYEGRVMQMANRPELYKQLRRGYYFQFCSLTATSPRGQAVMLACPIRDNKGVIGDLWVVNESGDCFTDSQIRLIQQVATQCAIAIRQARLYQASRNQIEELERLNHLKDDFLSTVSHELRTPMSNMKMAIHMLKTHPDSNRCQRYLDILESECKREVELINDLLDLQRLDDSSYSVMRERIQLHEWLPPLIESFQSQMGEYQQILDVDNLTNLPEIESDPVALRRIVVELINNACKYTPAQGGIRIKAGVGHDPVRKLPELWLQVKNQAAIAPDELPHIFEKFYRVPNGDPWSRGGTGLGLALVQKLVKQLDARLEVESEAGWTSFVVYLSVNPAFSLLSPHSSLLTSHNPPQVSVRQED